MNRTAIISVAALLLVSGFIPLLPASAETAPIAVPPTFSAPVPEPATDRSPAEEPAGDIGSGWIRDRAASWDRFDFFLGFDPEGNYAPDFATGPNGVIYAVYEEYDEENLDYNIALTYSPDGGVSWIGDGFFFVSQPFYPRATFDRHERHPSIAIDPFSSIIWIAYESWETPGGIVDINVTHASTADLLTWTEVTQAYDGGCPFFCFWAERPDFVLENRVSGPYHYVAFEVHSVFGIYVAVYGTQDMGGIWQDIYDSPTAPTGSEQRLPQLTFGYAPGDSCDKRAYLSYVFGYTGATVHEVRFETEVGICTALINGGDGPWGVAPSVLYNGTTDGIYPWFPTMANVYGNGTIVVAWEYDRTAVAAGNGLDVGYAFSTDDGATWSPEQLDFAGAGSDERAPRLAVDGEGWSVDTLGSFHLMYIRDPVFTGGEVMYASVRYDALPFGAVAPAQVADTAPIPAGPSASYLGTAITTHYRPDGAWYPVVGWTDLRVNTDHDIYATTPGGDVTIGTTPEGLWYGVNFTPYTTRTNWTVAAGFPVVVNTTNPQYVGGSTRWSLLYWTDTFDVLDHQFWMTPGDHNVTAIFYLEHLVTFDTVPTGLTLDIGGFPYATPAVLWLWDGVTYDLNATSPQIVGPGQRYVYSQWSNLGNQNQSILVTAPDTLIATYTYEVEITIDTNPSLNPVTVDGSLYTSPTPFWWAPGSIHQLDALPYVLLAPDTRLPYSMWTDDPAASHTYTTPGLPETVTAIYGTAEFLVSLDTSPTGLTYTVDDVPYTSAQTFWYAANLTTWINTTAVQTTGPTRYVFVNWSDTSSLLSRQETISSPRTLTANFLTQYEVTVDTQPAGLWFEVDGTTWYQGPQTFWWDALDVHTLVANSTVGTLNFARWLPDNVLTNSRVWTVTGPDTVTANYTAAPVPLTFTASAIPTSGLAPLVVAFSLTASGGDGNYLFTWDFDDTLTSTQEDPGHTFSTPGVYNVTVSVSDIGGNVTTPQVIQITVFAVPPVLDACSISPSSATVVVSGTQLFVAHGYNGTTELSPISTAWSVSGGIGIISSGGLFTAGTTAGSGNVTVDITYGTDTVTCTVPVQVTLTPPPTVAILTPLNFEIVVVPSVTVTGTSTNAVSVDVRVQNGTWQPATGTGTWTITLDLSSFSNANIRIEAIARGATSDSSPDDVTVALDVPPNAAPIANAGTDQSGDLKHLTVTLDGSGSTDADLDTLSFAWVQQSGPSITLTGATTAGPTFTPNVAGIYDFQLTVNDGTDSDTDTVRIIVTNRLPVIAGTSPPSATVSASKGATQSFLVTATDADNDTVTYTWTVNGAPQTGALASAFDFSATAIGTFVINVTVSDGEGTRMTSWTLTVSEGQGQAGFPLAPVLILLAIIVAAILLLLFLMKRRKKPAEDVPQAAPGQWAAAPTEPTTMPLESTETPQEWGSPAAAPAAAAPVVAPAATPAPAASTQDPMAQLARLRELKDQGLITDQEYEAKRKQLLEKL